jgi:hypothetical protein
MISRFQAAGLAALCLVVWGGAAGGISEAGAAGQLATHATPPVRSHGLVWVGDARRHFRRVYWADVNGDGTKDRIVIKGGHDLAITRYPTEGNGHYTVEVTLSGSHRIVRRRLDADAYTEGDQSRWTPYFGATNLGHGHEDDLVLGVATGAASETFAVLRARHGHLQTVKAPGQGLGQWLVNSDGSQQNGYKCVAGGISERSVFHGRNYRKWTVVRDHYIYRHGRWHHDHHYRTTTVSGRQPHGTNRFGYFLCSGLPRKEL